MRTEFASESEIKVISPTGDSRSTFLHNIWSECEYSPENRAEIVDRYVRVLFQKSGDTPELSKENIVVLIRDTQYRNFVAKEEWRDVMTDHLLGDLWMVLAVDLPDSMTTLTLEQVATLGLDKKDLIKLGIENVDRMLGRMEFNPHGECFTVGCEAIDYASSALLLDYVWDQAASLIEGDLIVALPARDTLLFTGSANTKGLHEIREAANHVVTTGNHVISEALLKRLDRHWKLFL